jgi:hypothetical protein
MNKIKYIPLALFCVFALKSLILGVVLYDVLLAAVLACISAFYEFKSNDREMQVLQTRCDEIDKHLTELYKADREFKDFVSRKNLTDLRFGQK